MRKSWRKERRPLAMHGKVVVVMNRRSGGKWSAEFAFNRFVTEFGSDNVLELFSADVCMMPERVKMFITLNKPDIIIVAGGDGTISFIMDIVKELHTARKLARCKGVIAPFPLGTGNDFSNSLGFGCGFARWLVFGHVRFERMLHHYAVAKRVCVDRWALTFQRGNREWTEAEPHRQQEFVMLSNLTSPHLECAPSQLPCTAVLETRTMNNYVSIGFEAEVVKRFNSFRSRHPHFFVSRPIVKLWYAWFAVISAILQRKIGCDVALEIDHVTIAVPEYAKAIVVSSALTYAGGSVLWNCEEEESVLSSFMPQLPCQERSVESELSLSETLLMGSSRSSKAATQEAKRAALATLQENTMTAQDCQNNTETIPSSPTLCPAALDDAKVEVSCLCGMWHLSLVRLGLCNGIKLGQGSRVKLQFPSNISCQYDGEPLTSLQRVNDTLILDIRHHSTSNVLHAAKASNRPRNWATNIAIIFLSAILILIYAYFISHSH